MFKPGDYIKATGRKRCIVIIGKVVEVILGGYKVIDADGITCYVRHEFFDVERWMG